MLSEFLILLFSKENESHCCFKSFLKWTNKQTNNKIIKKAKNKPNSQHDLLVIVPNLIYLNPSHPYLFSITFIHGYPFKTVTACRWDGRTLGTIAPVLVLWQVTGGLFVSLRGGIIYLTNEFGLRQPGN